jgi:hypothetical protein
MKAPSMGEEKVVSAMDRAARLVHPAVVLLVVSVLAYGLLLNQMGFFWDELPMSWIRYELGPEAMTKYFSTNRPVWGFLYQLTTAVMPHIPIYWEVLALLLRWVSSVLVWLIAANLWPKNREFGLTAALAFLVYPGFNQQWTSYLYSHFFAVMCFLLLSFMCSIWAVRNPARRVPITLAGVFLSALNLWMMEYFFILELLRPMLVFRVMAAAHPDESRRELLRRTGLHWLAYLIVFGANILWRLFVFNNQVYQPTLLGSIQRDPPAALAELVRSSALQLYRTSTAAWSNVLQLPISGQDGPRTIAYYAVVVLLSALVVGLWIAASRRRQISSHSGRWWPLGLGLAAMLLAGGPFLLTGLEVSLAYPANRFTLPFMLGVSLFLAGLLAFVPPAVRMWMIITLIGLAAGRQALWAEDYREDWITHKSMFWQMLWRAPGIKPNTLVLMNEGALPYYADNSLIGGLNWIYDPDNRSPSLDYALFYPTSRLGGSLPSLAADLPIQYDFISEVFTGNTSQVLAFYYQPPGCLRLLNPLIDSENRLIPEATMMREAAALSSSQWILPSDGAKMPRLFGPEPKRGWCYFFESAELAAQTGDWTSVAELGDKAFALDDHPNDPVERFVFIEGYARNGEVKRATELTEDSYRVSRTVMGPLLCSLWRRLEADAASMPEIDDVLPEIKSMLACSGE